MIYIKIENITLLIVILKSRQNRIIHRVIINFKKWHYKFMRKQLMVLIVK